MICPLDLEGLNDELDALLYELCEGLRWLAMLLAQTECRLPVCTGRSDRSLAVYACRVRGQRRDQGSPGESGTVELADLLAAEPRGDVLME